MGSIPLYYEPEREREREAKCKKVRNKIDYEKFAFFFLLLHEMVISGLG